MHEHEGVIDSDKKLTR